MNFAFDPDHLEFLAEVNRFIERNRDPAVMDVTRENVAQLADTPERRRFMRELSRKGWLGLTWPEEYGGQNADGIYEYMLNERLAAVGAPQIGKGVGIIGKTLIRHGSDFLKREFLPKILEAEVEFAIGYSEPGAGSDAAAMGLKAERHADGWLLNGQKVFSTSAHFAEWYWLAARTDAGGPKHEGITLFLVPLSSTGITIHPMETMGDERTNQVFLDDVFVHDDYRVGDEGQGFRYISEALDLERFTLFTFSPIKVRLLQLIDYLESHSRDGDLLIEHPWVRDALVDLITQTEVARLLGLKFLDAAKRGDKPPTSEASVYKVYSTELSQRIADAMMDLTGPDSQLESGDTAPMQGRAANSYAYSVVDTIGGGTSEVQRNIIARRKLNLPRPS
jgi:alkylation response protein AidB-like acyl-CoA dehydrogenase